MVEEKRKSTRRGLERPGWIIMGKGGEPRQCCVADVSQHGARLGVSKVNELPDYFVLRLSADGRVARRCMIVWRADTEVGVEFVGKGTTEALHAAQRVMAKAGTRI